MGNDEPDGSGGSRIPGPSNEGDGAGTPPTTMMIYEFATQLRSSLERYRNYRRAVRELSALDDRQLCDIGLVRSRIEEVARGALH